MKKLLNLLVFLAKLSGLGLLYGLVRSLGWLFGARWRAALLALGAVGALGLVGPKGCLPGAGPTRVATFNIRRFGVEPTDMKLLKSTLGEVGADIVAVQEIQSVARLDELTRALSGPFRSYRHTLASCGGKSEMLVGFVYDEKRVTLKKTREFLELEPEGKGGCTEGERAGLLGVFEADGRELNLLVVHLTAGGAPEKAEKRRGQWAKAMRIVDKLKAEGAKNVALLGDANSTGFLDNRHGEGDFIKKLVAQKGLELPTEGLGCSEYWLPNGKSELEPSLLDHVIASPGLVKKGSARVHGYCQALACRPRSQQEAPAEFVKVSDHCPVSFAVGE